MNNNLPENNQAENEEYKDFNPYIGMRERLYKEPTDDNFNPKVEKAIRVLILLLNIFTIASMWLFVFYFNLCLQSQTSMINHSIFAISVIMAIVFTTIIPAKTKYGLDSQSLIALIFMVLLTTSTTILIFAAIFVPVFIVVVITLVFVIVFLIFAISESSFKITNKIKIIVVTALVSLLSLLSLVKHILL